MISTRSLIPGAVLSLAAWLTLAPAARADGPHDVLREIPVVSPSAKRPFAVEDLLYLRDIDALSVSPDGAHFAIRVRQAVPEKNSYRTGWFVGARRTGALVFVGDGGEVFPNVRPEGNISGDLSRGVGQWSPDGSWVVYRVKRDGEVQLWRSRRDGSAREQLTRNSGDVRDFVWSEDGRSVYFTAAPPRSELQARYEAEARSGYRYEDFGWITRVVSPGHPPRPPETAPGVWILDVDKAAERLATAEEARDFERLRGAGKGRVRSSRGSSAWLATEGGASSPVRRVTVSLTADGSNPIPCTAPECSGQRLSELWWSADAGRVLFWNLDPQNWFDWVLHAWSPSTGRVTTVVPSSSERFNACAMRGDELICLRETDIQPAHVAAIDTRSGKITALADVNPELVNVRFGKVERIEWDVPETVPGIDYPSRAMGYILYPPDFDPARKYPVFISPYTGGGFHRGDTGDEHPMFAYAANGIIVLDTIFPIPMRGADMTDTEFMKRLYSGEHDFPHMTTLVKSTLRALDLVAKRGFVDERRVGIGGVSQGSFVPLYMLQKEDRLTAVSVAGGHWNPMQYYGSSPKGRQRDTEWYPAPFGDTQSWWNRIDVAQHVNEIEAPILFNFPDAELVVSLTLLRHLENERKPFDAYVFPNEYHLKWQSAHREAVYRRNLDWFRFWLQDYEDPAPEKRDQYARWQQLRKLQCDSPRSLRDFCGTEAAAAGR
jgi:dipeptidyl aminopeptidase/acylaminoacyl peptidase